MIRVVSIFEHPRYNFVNKNYDVAIMKLAKAVENVSTIALAEANDKSRVGELAITTGWGETLNVSEPHELLRAVHVPIVDQETCREAYKPVEITDQMFCAGYPEGGNIN